MEETKVNLNRRLIVGCALCALPGLIATSTTGLAQPAPAATAGVKRKILSQVDGPTPGYVTVAVELEIEPGAVVARHTHPGIESTYFISGSGELLVDGQPSKPFKAGDAIQIAPGAIHSVKNGPAATKGIGTYIVEKGKPLASPA
jgi:quercetin dioxygenase-like cupin family protein